MEETSHFIQILTFKCLNISISLKHHTKYIQRNQELSKWSHFIKNYIYSAHKKNYINQMFLFKYWGSAVPAVGQCSGLSTAQHWSAAGRLLHWRVDYRWVFNWYVPPSFPTCGRWCRQTRTSWFEFWLERINVNRKKYN